jgi:hypothetical protein
MPGGTSAPLSGSIVQPEGVSAGTRVVPLQYPMSVQWGGSRGLAVGSGPAAVAAARRQGATAILDPATRMLTGLRPGTVTVSVTGDSMRPFTGPSSLAPIVAQQIVQVTAAGGHAPHFTASTPVFSTQAVDTAGGAQAVVVRNTGGRPLRIGRVALHGDRASFRLAGGACGAHTLAPHGSCTVLVRFAPNRAAGVAHARLVFEAGARRRSVALTGRSVRRPVALMPDGAQR